MTLNAKQLTDSREDIATVLEAFRSEDTSEVSSGGHSLVSELAGLDDTRWNILLESLEEDELREQMELLRKHLDRLAASRQDIHQVKHSASFTSAPSAQINLTFRAGNQTLATRQDLEDTLWVGVAVVQVVRETMHSMEKALKPPAQRACISSDFEGKLVQAEEAIAEIRQMYEAVCKETDARD